MESGLEDALIATHEARPRLDAAMSGVARFTAIAHDCAVPSTIAIAPLAQRDMGGNSSEAADAVKSRAATSASKPAEWPSPSKTDDDSATGYKGVFPRGGRFFAQ